MSCIFMAMKVREQKLGVSERRVCRVIGQPRSTQWHLPRVREDEEQLRTEIVRLASRYGRYGYRRMSILLEQEGWPGRFDTG